MQITHVASHERNVTKLHYMTLCHDAMHRQVQAWSGPWSCGCLAGTLTGGRCCSLAGFGADWAHAQNLERAADVIAGMRGLIVPGLEPLVQALKAVHPDHPILHTLEALSWMVEVWWVLRNGPT